MKALDAREQRFVLEYLVSLDPKDAAIKAGYSKTVAASKAYQWVSNGKVKPHVFAAIRAAQGKTAAKLELTREATIAELAKLGFSNPKSLYRADGTLKAIHELTDDEAACIQSLEIDMRKLDGPDSALSPVLKIRWADKKTALDSIMKAQGWNLPDQVEVAGKGGGAIQHEHRARVVIVPPKVAAEVETRSLPRDEVDL